MEALINLDQYQPLHQHFYIILIQLNARQIFNKLSHEKFAANTNSLYLPLLYQNVSYLKISNILVYSM